jgi:hypothetical protein
MSDGVKMCDKHRWAFGMACPACRVKELEAKLSRFSELQYKRLDEANAKVRELVAEKSARRQKIRDGWNIEFDRETGHEMWVLDEPPLETGKLLDNLVEENKRLKAGLDDARTGNRWRGDDIDRLKSKNEKQRLEIVNLMGAEEISGGNDGDQCDVMVGCKQCGRIARYRSMSADEVEDLRAVLKDRDASIEKLKAEIVEWGDTANNYAGRVGRLEARIALYELRKDAKF